MADRQPTVWQLEPHTAAKHDVLRKYLGAWFPKLAWKKRLLFIDGFAGPGEYDRGEPGSPIIALNAAIQHKSDLSGCELVYIFIEQDKARFENLNALIENQTIPSNISWQAVRGTFSDCLNHILSTLESTGQELAPAFIMIDPFGFAGMPMELIAKVGAYQKTELLISFMYESINRWLSQPNLAGTINELFGCADWQEANGIVDSGMRKEFLLSLYMRQLREVAGMEYPRAFEMMDRGNRTEYFLIYATHSIEGLKAMKSAMWGVDPWGSFQFSDATVSDQLTLFTPEPDYDQLKRLIVGRFGGTDARVEDVETFVVVETAFRETHFKRQILVPMENAGELSVVKSPRKRAGTYPPGTVIRFK